ncbi:hypothetical protein THRCLA_20675 [Thraustotheca clavata]|uniref:Transmembrane protein n=1 Tax=Thraustotheca clavata TaxID=74557 RepID=A0A1W0A4T2_9STRA|nr:hypothetical protein THRCLA_20675 [Thraustotheca clavata]
MYGPSSGRILSISHRIFPSPPKAVVGALYRVYFNKRSVFASFIMLINVAIMPLKAYISEPFPWKPMEPTQFLASCSPNVILCMPQVLDYIHNKSQGMPVDKTHIEGRQWDVFRFTLPPLPSKDEDPFNYLVEMPFYNFYTPYEQSLVSKIVQRKINISEFRTIQAELIFSVPFSYAVFWTEPNNTLYVGFLKETTTLSWVAFKFSYRIGFCIYIIARMWHQYFQHYHHLAKNLRAFGLEGALRSDSIEIVMGDPTSIILLNPMVSIIFVIDVWVSMEYISVAIAKLNQLVVAHEIAIACLYLSRTLWFAYGTLNGISYILKKIHKEKSFTEADPTLTAMAVMIAVGPLTKVQAQAIFFVQLYYYIFQCFARDTNSNEISIAIVLYTIIIGSLPISFGLTSKWLHKCHSRRVSSSVAYGSFMMNDIKHRFTHHFNFMSLSEPACIVKGGTLYQLFAQDCKYKQNLAISQRGTDCYLLFGVGDKRTSVRLSLLSSIDTNHHIPSITKPKTAFGQLYLDENKIRLERGADNSPWTA